MCHGLGRLGSAAGSTVDVLTPHSESTRAAILLASGKAGPSSGFRKGGFETSGPCGGSFGGSQMSGARPAKGNESPLLARPLTAIRRRKHAVERKMNPFSTASFARGSSRTRISRIPESTFDGVTTKHAISEAIWQGAGSFRRSRNSFTRSNRRSSVSECGYSQSPSSSATPITDPRTSTPSKPTRRPGITLKAQAWGASTSRSDVISIRRRRRTTSGDSTEIVVPCLDQTVATPHPSMVSGDRITKGPAYSPGCNSRTAPFSSASISPWRLPNRRTISEITVGGTGGGWPVGELVSAGPGVGVVSEPGPGGDEWSCWRKSLLLNDPSKSSISVIIVM